MGLKLCVSEQVGTLDVLVGVSDDLDKLDSFVERFDVYLQLQSKMRTNLITVRQ